MIRLLLTSEMDKIWEEAIVSYFNVLLVRHLPVGTEKKHKNLSENLERDLK